MYNLVKEHKTVDECFVDKVIEVLIREYDLNLYVNRRKVSNMPKCYLGKEVFGEYSFISKSMIIYLNTMLETLNYRSKKLGLDSQTRAYYIVTEVIATINHEISHAKQLKQYYSHDSDLEALIVKASLISISPFWDINYVDSLLNRGYTEEEIYEMYEKIRNKLNLLYNFNPLEKVAEDNSLNNIALILKELNISDVLSYQIILRIVKNYRRGYQKNMIPIKYFLSQIGSLDYYPEIESLGYEASLNERLARDIFGRTRIYK